MTLGTAGSSAGVVNLTSGTLAVTAGNELAVSKSFVQGNITITAGTSPFKVGGSNVVNAIDKLMVQGGTTKIVNATYANSISLVDNTTQWDTGTASAPSNAFTVSGGANALIVEVSWRHSPTVQSDVNAPMLTYNGVPLTLAKGAYGLINAYVNSAVYYLYNPTAGSNTLATTFQSGVNTDAVINAFTLGGVDTAQHPELIAGWTGATAIEAAGTTVDTTLNNLAPHAWVVGAFAERKNGTGGSTSLGYGVTSGTYGSLDTSGTGGGNGAFWFSNRPGTGTMSAAGALVRDVTSSSLTIQGIDLIATNNRMSQAAAAFAGTSTLFAINQPTTAVDVTGTSTLDFGAAPTVTLGSLAMQSGSSLTLSNTPAASVSFSGITAAGAAASTIAVGVPISIGGGSVAVSGGGGLTIASPLGITNGSSVDASTGTALNVTGNVTTTQTSGDMNWTKTGLGVMNITGATVFTDTGSLANRTIKVTQGNVNFTNATVYLSSLITQTNNNVYINATNSSINIDDTVNSWYNGGLRVGWGNGVASYSMNGGSLSLNDYGNDILIAQNGNTGKAVLSVDGGATVHTGGIELAGTDNTFGEFNVRNGTVTNTWKLKVGTSKGIGVVNLLGGTIDNNSDEINLQYRMNQANGWGIVNLNGGTMKATQITTGDGTANFTGNRSYINFHGGTLSPVTSSGNFVYSTITGVNAGNVSAPQLMVYAEGAVIDTAGNNITISVPLQAPAGNGVVETTITLSGADQGSGYRGEPVVKVELTPGGLDNVTSTAVANMVDDGTGHGTFKIASITITNPGVNFTTAPSLNIYGGDPTMAATLPALTIAANVSGGLTKSGLGTLVLSAANTFSGPTTVSAGTLSLATASALATSSVSVSSGATLSLVPAVQAVVAGLSVAGKVDLDNSRLTIKAGGMTESDLRAAVIAGRNGGTWNGASGIESSVVAAANGTRAVGYKANSDGSLTVAYSAQGDTNLNGVVDLTDLSSILAAGKYNTGSTSNWTQGDFNYDSVVDLTDLSGILATGLYNQGSYLSYTPSNLAGGLNGAPSLAGGLNMGGVPVPEPSTAVLVGIGMALACLGLRNRRQTA